MDLKAQPETLKKITRGGTLGVYIYTTSEEEDVKSKKTSESDLFL